MTRDESQEIAREHVTWALANGQNPAQIIMSVGARLPCCDLNRTDADAAVIVAYQLLRVMRRRAVRAPA